MNITLQFGNRYQLGALTNATAVIRDADTLPPRVNSIRRLGGNTVIEFDAAAGRSYVLQGDAAPTGIGLVRERLRGIGSGGTLATSFHVVG